ncbi:hypothetical protein D9M68_1005660 [compost metagenome]
MGDPRRLVGGALLLALFGALLMLPPLVYLFDHPITHFGIPQIVLYLFALWLLMIIGTGLITHAMPRQKLDDDGEGDL